MTSISRAAVLAVACVLAAASATVAGDRGKGGKDNGRERSNQFIWKHKWEHENGCAIGNDPPPGANCTNRDDQNGNRR